MRRYNELTNINKENIIKAYYEPKYSNFKIEDIAKLLHISERGFKRVLVENGINTRLKRRYTIKNQDYFNIIDTENKAYFLGLLFADGYNGNNNEISITLKNTGNTEEILNILMKELGIKGLNLTKFKNKQGFISNNEFIKLGFSNKTINSQLLKLGMSPHKEKSRNFIPQDIIDNNLVNHFIRGLFDGDGSVGIYHELVKRKTDFIYVDKPLFGLLSNEKLLNLIKNYLITDANVSEKVSVRQSSNSTKIFEIKYKGKQVYNIINYLYKNANIYLSHKQIKSLITEM